MIKLVRSSGPGRGTEFVIDRPGMRLGRDPGCEITLQDSQVSKQHAEISQSGDQTYIRDLGSTNGTFVNNQRVSGAQLLQPGDQIRIGDTILACELAAAGAYGGGVSDWQAPYLTAAGPAVDRRRRALLWTLGGAAAVLLVALGIAIALLMRAGNATLATPEVPLGEGASQTVVGAAPVQTVVGAITNMPTLVANLAQTVMPGLTLPAQSTSAASAPTGAAVATDTPAPTVTVEPTKTSKPTPKATPPAKPQALPTPPQGAGGALEQLPALVAAAFPGVSAEQMPQVLGSQLQSMPPEQLQAMIGSLFPGVDPAQLPQVVAASFPELQQPQIQALLKQVFPGQNVPLPNPGPVGGRLLMGIYDKTRDQHDLYLVNAIGGRAAFVTDQASEPNLAPDGEWIVYFSWASDHFGLRLIKTDGTGDTELTSIREHGYPTFSPDGQRISFYNSKQDILHVINRDGSDRRDIGKGEFPAWSPSGKQIVFRGCAGGGKCGLMVAGTDGSNPRLITTHANDAAPRWSPNGGQIAFHSDRDGNWEIYVINSDGSWLRRITDNPTTDIMPVWSPNGLRIAFRSDRGGRGAVWVTSGIGGVASKLLDAEFDPDWPDLAQMDWAR